MDFVERRAFPRRRLDYATELTLPDGTALRARIVEASQRGLRILLQEPLETDTPVRLTIDSQMVLGNVCYCAERTDGFYLGLYLENSLAGLEDLARLSRLLSEDDRPVKAL